MDKKTALRVLIENSFVLEREVKNKLLAVVERMTDEQIDEWGKMLADEQIFVAENKEEILAKINSLEFVYGL